MKKTKCGPECKACLICEREKQCCICSHTGYHGCVTWPRKEKKKGGGLER